MRGSSVYQVETIFYASGVNKIGESKHEAKEAVRANGARTTAEIGEHLGIHSYATADRYRDIWIHLLKWVKARYGVKDIEGLQAEHIEGFLMEKMEKKVSLSTFLQYAAACLKLERALNLYSQTYSRGYVYHFREAVQEVRVEARKRLKKFKGSRAYEDPEVLILAIEDRDHQLAAAMQLEGGPRIREIALIREGQVDGRRRDPVTGQEKGYIGIKGKGGKIISVALSPKTYEEVQRHIQTHGEFRIAKTAYYKSLKKASLLTDQDYNASHGLRWNFAQNRFQEVQKHGMCFEEALYQVSREMGHERADITERYLR